MPGGPAPRRAPPMQPAEKIPRLQRLKNTARSSGGRARRPARARRLRDHQGVLARHRGVHQAARLARGVRADRRDDPEPRHTRHVLLLLGHHGLQGRQAVGARCRAARGHGAGWVRPERVPLLGRDLGVRQVREARGGDAALRRDARQGRPAQRGLLQRGHLGEQGRRDARAGAA